MLLTSSQIQELRVLLPSTFVLLDVETHNPTIEVNGQRVGLFFEQDGSVSYYKSTTNCCHPPAFDYDGTTFDLARKLTEVVQCNN